MNELRTIEEQYTSAGNAGDLTVTSCFYAVEGGHVVGTPFAQAVDPALAGLIVQFGLGFLFLLQQEGE